MVTSDKVSTVSGDVFVMYLLKRLLNSVDRCFFFKGNPRTRRISD